MGNLSFEKFTNSGVPTWEIYKKTGGRDEWNLTVTDKAGWLSMSVASAASTPVLVVDYVEELVPVLAHMAATRRTDLGAWRRHRVDLSDTEAVR